MSALSNSPLYDVQERLLAYLRQQSFFVGNEIRWIERQEGKLLNDIDAGRSQLKLACFVYPPLLGDGNPNLPGPIFDNCTLRITWFENYEMRHGAGVHSDRYAIETARHLHQVKLPDFVTLGLITVQPEQAIEWSLTKQGLQQWDCWLTADIRLPCINA